MLRLLHASDDGRHAFDLHRTERRHKWSDRRARRVSLVGGPAPSAVTPVRGRSQGRP